jgi:hypothetical protein
LFHATRVPPFIPAKFFFSHNNNKKNYMPMQLKCSTSIQKQASKNILFFEVVITFFSDNVSDFYTYFTAEN